ncbi:hypothetical protein [Kitasatospora sp. NPDC056184]|uniref:hypothetical protein n=1 Tax=Kitasatospora sp. NPDC056184 TaxID=3345738 RepID=UPI0035DF2223
MSEPSFTDAAGTTPRPRAGLPIAFRAFQELHAQPYFDFACTVLGDQTLAQHTVNDVFLSLVDRWDRVLTDPNPHAYAWAALRCAVEAQRARDTQHRLLIERVVFSAVAVGVRCISGEESGHHVERGLAYDHAWTLTHEGEELALAHLRRLLHVREPVDHRVSPAGRGSRPAPSISGEAGQTSLRRVTDQLSSDGRS